LSKTFAILTAIYAERICNQNIGFQENRHFAENRQKEAITLTPILHILNLHFQIGTARAFFNIKRK
jgi:hypothetical protein